MDTKINLESLLPPTGMPVTAIPANGNPSFAQAFLQQLKGMPDTPGGDAPADTQLPGFDSLIDSLLTKLSDTSFAGQSAKSDKTFKTGPDALDPNTSTPDTSAINPLILALLNGVPPAQIQSIVQNSAAPANDSQSASQLGVGMTGDSAGTARALRRMLTTLEKQGVTTGDMTRNPKAAVSEKGLPVAAAPDVTPKPITPAIDPAPKPITPVEVQSTSFIPPAVPDGIMTPATPKLPDSKTVAAGQSVPISSLSGKNAGLPTTNQTAPQAANQTAVQPVVQNTDPKNHSDTSSQSGAGQNSSDTESKKKLPDAQFSATAVQPDSSHSQAGNITILPQPAGQNVQSQHSTTGSSSGTPAQSANAIVANDTVAPRVVHEARIMQAAGQAEMQISMRSESAGTVNVKAMLEGSHLSATVSSPSVETRDWLVNNLHELHAGLLRDDLNLRSFQVADSSLQGGWNGPDARQQQSQEQYRSATHNGGNPGTPEETLAGADLNSLDLNETASQALSLHA